MLCVVVSKTFLCFRCRTIAVTCAADEIRTAVSCNAKQKGATRIELPKLLLVLYCFDQYVHKFDEDAEQLERAGIHDQRRNKSTKPVKTNKGGRVTGVEAEVGERGADGTQELHIFCVCC